MLLNQRHVLNITRAHLGTSQSNNRQGIHFQPPYKTHFNGCDNGDNANDSHSDSDIGDNSDL